MSKNIKLSFFNKNKDIIKLHNIIINNINNNKILNFKKLIYE